MAAIRKVFFFIKNPNLKKSGGWEGIGEGVARVRDCKRTNCCLYFPKFYEIIMPN